MANWACFAFFRKPNWPRVNEGPFCGYMADRWPREKAKMTPMFLWGHSGPAFTELNKTVLIHPSYSNLYILMNLDYSSMIAIPCNRSWIVRHNGLLYRFYKGGFIDVKQSQFKGSKQKISVSGSFTSCVCSKEGFTMCPRCDSSFCVDCSWVKLHCC